MSDRAQRRQEGVRIIEHRLDGQAGKVPIVVTSGRDDLNGLELIAVFKHRVSDRPSLNIGSPRD